MKNIIVVAIAAVGLSSIARAQCISCGPDAGPPPNVFGDVATSTFRSSVVPDAFPGKLGTATITVRTHSEPLLAIPGGVPHATTTEFLIDYNLTAPATLTSVELHSAVLGSAGDTVLDLGVTPAMPVMLAAGKGTVALQGPPDWFISASAPYYVYVRVAGNPLLLPLGILLTAHETTAIAQLAPPAGLAAIATGALTADIARDSSGVIAGAEVRFDVRYRLASPFNTIHFTALRLRVGGPAGPVVFDSGLSDVAAAPSGEGTLAYREQIDPGNVAAVVALETLAQDPAAFYFELQTSTNPPAAMGGQLAAPETLRYILCGTPGCGHSEPTSGPVADGAVTIKVLRDSFGNILAGLATLDLIYQHFSPGTVFTSVSIFGDGTIPLDPTVNGLTVGPSGTGSIFQRIPLLPGSPLLNPPGEANNFVTLNTQSSPAGAVTLGVPGVPQALPTGPAINAIVPSYSPFVSASSIYGRTAPGSIISVFGKGFTANSFLIVGEMLAQILYVGPNQINALVSPQSPVGFTTPIYVVDNGQVSNTAMLLVDVAQPYIFVDLSGPYVIDESTGAPVRLATPAKRGDRIQVYATGLTSRADIVFSAQIGDTSISNLVISPVHALAGVWVIEVQIPVNAAVGMIPLQIIASGNGRQAPSNTVTIWIQ